MSAVVERVKRDICEGLDSSSAVRSSETVNVKSASKVPVPNLSTTQYRVSKTLSGSVGLMFAVVSIAVTVISAQL